MENVNRAIVKTFEGYTIYGAFTATMRLNEQGKVIYSNVNPDCPEYQKMRDLFKPE